MPDKIDWLKLCNRKLFPSSHVIISTLSISISKLNLWKNKLKLIHYTSNFVRVTTLVVVWCPLLADVRNKPNNLNHWTSPQVWKWCLVPVRKRVKSTKAMVDHVGVKKWMSVQQCNANWNKNQKHPKFLTFLRVKSMVQNAQSWLFFSQFW